MNSVTLIGNLTRDAELKYGRNGTAICTFSIADNQRRKVGDDWKDEAHFFDVTILGKRGEALQRYLVKGKLVGIEGKLQQDRWTDDSGGKRSKVKILARDIKLCGGSEGKAGGGPNTDNGGTSGDTGGSDDFEDDVPF